jgi:osmoprotectant transport system ATP-binding protein
MIQLIQVSKQYDELDALDQVDLLVHPGECLVLIGPSGCGKSTLLKTINRLVKQDQGIVLVNDKNVEDYPVESLRKQIGYCIQGVGLFPHFNVFDNIAVVPRLLHWPIEQIQQRVNDLLVLTGLPSSYLSKRPHELSGGEAQRVGVCRALAADPEILLMDEPFGAVDPMTREQIQLAFLQIQRQLRKTVVFVTHDIEEALLLGDRIAIMHQGKIIAIDTPGNLLMPSQPDFVKDFIGKDYLIRLLRKYQISDIKNYSTQVGGSYESHLTEESTLKELLASMIQKTDSMVGIRLHDGSIINLTYFDIIKFIAQVSDHE